MSYYQRLAAQYPAQPQPTPIERAPFIPPVENDSLEQLHCQHPWKLVFNTILDSWKNLTLTLVKYRTLSQDYGITVPVKQILSGDLNNYLLDKELKVMGTTYVHSEIGVLSRVVRLYDGAISFIPMIDFIGKPDIASLIAVCNYAKGALPHGTSFEIYSTGNSYHAYFSKLCSANEYSAFVTRLMNSPHVDQRWLEAGAERVTINGPRPHALRWTNFTTEKGRISRIRTNV